MSKKRSICWRKPHASQKHASRAKRPTPSSAKAARTRCRAISYKLRQRALSTTSATTHEGFVLKRIFDAAVIAQTHPHALFDAPPLGSQTAPMGFKSTPAPNIWVDESSPLVSLRGEIGECCSRERFSSFGPEVAANKLSGLRTRPMCLQTEFPHRCYRCFSSSGRRSFRSPLALSVGLALGSFTLAPLARAVNPPPDGGLEVRGRVSRRSSGSVDFISRNLPVTWAKEF